MAHPDTLARSAYSVEDAAAALSISRRSAYRRIAVGELRTVKLGGRRLVPAAELARLTGSLAVTPPEFANREDSGNRGCEPVAPPEKPHAPPGPAPRVNLSELLARVR